MSETKTVFVPVRVMRSAFSGEAIVFGLEATGACYSVVVASGYVRDESGAPMQMKDGGAFPRRGFVEGRNPRPDPDGIRVVISPTDAVVVKPDDIIEIPPVDVAAILRAAAERLRAA